jgi:hypothetical protein
MNVTPESVKYSLYALHHQWIESTKILLLLIRVKKETPVGEVKTKLDWKNNYVLWSLHRLLNRWNGDDPVSLKEYFTTNIVANWITIISLFQIVLVKRPFFENDLRTFSIIIKPYIFIHYFLRTHNNEISRLLTVRSSYSYSFIMLNIGRSWTGVCKHQT